MPRKTSGRCAGFAYTPAIERRQRPLFISERTGKDGNFLKVKDGTYYLRLGVCMLPAPYGRRDDQRKQPTNGPLAVVLKGEIVKILRLKP
jgi:hypothetical protein